MNIEALLRVDDSQTGFLTHSYGLLLMGLVRNKSDGLLVWCYRDAAWGETKDCWKYWSDRPIISRIICRQKEPQLSLFTLPYEEGDI